MRLFHAILDFENGNDLQAVSVVLLALENFTEIGLSQYESETDPYTKKPDLSF